MLTNNDKRIIKRVRFMPKSQIDRLDNSGIVHYEIGLFNAIEHLCPHSEYNTDKPWDDRKCSSDCRHVNKCNLIVNLLCRIKPVGMLISNPA